MVSGRKGALGEMPWMGKSKNGYNSNGRDGEDEGERRREKEY